MNEETETRHIKEIEENIAAIPDFPKQGIIFRDIMPIFANHRLTTTLVDVLVSRIERLDVQFDRMVGLEARGFLVGIPLSLRMKVPFFPIRKKGKLPGEVYSVEYQLEYGTDVLQIQKDVIPRHSRCLIIDDLIATGGSIQAAKSLISQCGCETTACLVVIELKNLNGREKIAPTPLHSLLTY